MPNGYNVSGLAVSESFPHLPRTSWKVAGMVAGEALGLIGDIVSWAPMFNRMHSGAVGYSFGYNCTRSCRLKSVYVE